MACNHTLTLKRPFSIVYVYVYIFVYVVYHDVNVYVSTMVKVEIQAKICGSNGHSRHLRFNYFLDT